MLTYMDPFEGTKEITASTTLYLVKNGSQYSIQATPHTTVGCWRIDASKLLEKVSQDPAAKSALFQDDLLTSNFLTSAQVINFLGFDPENTAGITQPIESGARAHSGFFSKPALATPTSTAVGLNFDAKKFLITLMPSIATSLFASYLLIIELMRIELQKQLLSEHLSPEIRDFSSLPDLPEENATPPRSRHDLEWARRLSLMMSTMSTAHEDFHYPYGILPAPRVINDVVWPQFPSFRTPADIWGVNESDTEDTDSNDEQNNPFAPH